MVPPAPHHTAARPSARGMGRWLAVVSPLVALVVIRPWVAGAFPVWDFMDMLPILDRSRDLAEAVTNLAAFTRADGRANYLTYLQVALTWLAVGEHPVGWQWQRAILMLVLGGVFAWTVLRLHGTPLAAGASAILLVIAVPGTEGWLFLVGEPLAAILLLAIVLTGQRATRRGWHAGHVAAIAALALGVMLAKEAVGVLIPVALAVGVLWHPGHGMQWHLPRAPHGPRLIAALTAVVLVEGVILGSALADARVDAYATGFRPDAASASRAPVLLQAMLLPVRFATAPASSLLYPANLAWLVLAGAGIALAWRAAAARRRHLQLVLVLFAAPVLGAGVYALWPRYSAFYGLPFSLGAAGLFAGALTIAQRTGRLGTVAATTGAVIVLGYTALASQRTAGERRAFADLALATTRALASAPPLDTLLVVKAGPGGNRWPVTGAELRQYAIAMHTPASALPLMLDTPCDVVARRLTAPLRSVGVLNDQNRCGSLPVSTMRLMATVAYRDWWTLRPADDTLAIELLLPEQVTPDTAARSATAPAAP